MPVLRFLFAPEFTRSIGEAGAVLRRLVTLAAFAVPPRGSEPVSLKALGNPRRRSRLVFGLLLVAAGLASAALWLADGAEAQQTFDAGLFEAEDDDTRLILSFLHDLASETGSTVLGDMLWIFNAGVLVLAGVLIVYQVVAGTVDTARQGRLGFGGWQIIRVVTAVAMMAPLAGGLNGGQHAVLALANLGGDFANAVWSPFTSDILSATRDIAPARGQQAIRTIIARALVAETCLFAANGAAPGDLVERREETARDDHRVTVRYAGIDPDVPPELCGAIVYDGLRHLDVARPPRVYGRMGSPPLEAEAAAVAAGRVPAAHYHALNNALAGDLRAMAAELGSRFLPVQGGAYGEPLPPAEAWLASRGLDRAYTAILGRALEGSREEHDEAMRELAEAYADETSWLMAASFFNTLAWQNGRFENAAADTPEVSLPAGTLGRWSPHASAAVQNVLAWLSTSTWSPIPLAGGIGGGLASGAAGPQDVLGGLFSFIDIDMSMLATGRNPIVELAAFGHALVTTSLIAITTLSATAAGNNLAEAIPIIGGALDVFEATWTVLDGFVTMLLTGMLIAGLVLAYLVPVIPFVRFLFGILTWLLAVVEAVLSITIFAAAHVTREDADTLATRSTRMGWLFLPGLVLRPVLMIFGLVLGYYAFLAVMELLNAVWVPMMQMAHGSGSADPLGFVTMLVLYTVIAYTAINGAFKLIDILPSQVLSWIGGAAGPDAGGTEGVSTTTIGAAGRFGGLTPRAPGRRGGGGAQQSVPPLPGGAGR